MKKLLLFTVFAVSAVLLNNNAQAQANWEAGVRFGDNFSVDATIPIGARPRLHAAAYFNNDFGLGGYFDWMFALNDGPAGLKFYPGVGPEFFFVPNDFQFNIAGDFGAEYSFDFPLTIGFDWRPAIQTTNDFNFSAGNWGFIARFRFGEGTIFHKTN
jgi:hypothetical protein